MKIFKKTAGVGKVYLCLILLLSHYSSVNASPSCLGCNIVEEGAFTNSLPNHYVYEYDISDKKFYKVIILRVRTTGFGPEVFWKDPNNSNNTGWNDARNYYTEQAVSEIKSGAASARLSPSDQQQKTGLIAACAIAEKARKEGDNISYFFLRNACCNSSAAKRFGTPPGVC